LVTVHAEMASLGIIISKVNKMSFKDSVPIYIQIANDIKEQVVSGKLVDGEKLKSVREYAVFYEVTPLTVQRAMQLLETESVIQAKKGIGSFIVLGARSTLESMMIHTHVKEFVRGMKNMGIHTEESVLELVKEALTDE